MASQEIVIKGARVHNLKNIDVTIPKNKLVVITGVSGSGKSSLCIDTLFAEGQRRYVESLSSYARQFLDRMDKPDVDYITGLCPAISIEQKVLSKSSRSTVGSLTEIYDYLRLFFARVGKTYSPVSGKEVKRDSVSDAVNYALSLKEGSMVMVEFPVELKRELPKQLEILKQSGFVRVNVDGDIKKIDQVMEAGVKTADSLRVVVDRIAIRHEDDDLDHRIADSVSIAFSESNGYCIISTQEGKEATFSNRFEMDGIEFNKPNPHFFNFNNPYGACKACEGFGSVIGIDEDLVIPDKSKSVYEGALVCWRGEKMGRWLEKLISNASEFDFPIHKPVAELTKEHLELLWTGNKHFRGLNKFFSHLEEKSYKIQYRVLLARYRGKTKCTECRGSRIRKEAQYVKIDGKSIGDLLTTPIDELKIYFKKIKLDDHQSKIAKRILLEVNQRLELLLDVGLDYLTLNRMASTLSGGETQRINLTRSIGSNLTNSMYILDEPSIGLHSRDTERLIKVLQNLRDLKNTVLVVEHDEDIMLQSDHLIDMGPEAGIHGGEIVYNGTSKDIVKSNSLTAEYLNNIKEIRIPEHTRKGINHIILKGASHFNLKGIDIKIPLNCMTVVSGVSGSGKTTLIKKILYPAMNRYFEGYGEKPGAHRELSGELEKVSSVEMIDQNPLGRSSRSNPVTYVKAYDAIRDLYSNQQLSKIRGYKPKAFSFNVEGGRCETCKGEGEVIVEMQFLADVKLVCDTCRGRRFKEDVLEVEYEGKNISDVLDLSIEEAISFFKDRKEIIKKIKPLKEIGLGYVKLGQSSSTLSGGEAQRVKLASFLNKGQTDNPILFIFDEPTTGLHFHDIAKLLTAFNKLISIGHTVVVIEHHMDVIKCADWVIDLGPEGGKNGGHLVYQGEVKGLLEIKESYTARYLKLKFKKNGITV